MQLILNNPEAFDSTLAHYGSFENVQNHIALIGPAGGDLEERCGYYGERVVLLAQSLGLNTCWVALTYKKKNSAAQIAPGEKFVLCLAIGYGKMQGGAHKIKTAEKVSRIPSEGEMPDWFKAGIDAALLAPTAMNQQRFRFDLQGTDNQGIALVRANALPTISCGKVDLGIAKLHFELGANTVSNRWRFV